MLAEAVIGKENFFFRAIRNHAVRPMEHRNGNEFQIAFADIEAVAGFHAGIRMVAAEFGDIFEPVRLADENLRIRAVLQYGVYGAGMVGFKMIADYIVDFGRVNNGRDAVDDFSTEFFFYRINQRDFFIND